jgi:hypothetical protein
MFAADFLADARNGFFDESGSGPLWLRFADLKQEVAKDRGSLLGVIYLRMELHGMNFPDSVFHCRDSVFRFAGGAESAWNGKHAVAVAVPYLKFYRQAFEKFRAVAFEFCVKLGAAIFAALYRFHSAAENAGNPLHAVADTKDWNSSGQDRGITFRASWS